MNGQTIRHISSSNRRVVMAEVKCPETSTKTVLQSLLRHSFESEKAIEMLMSWSKP